MSVAIQHSPIQQYLQEGEYKKAFDRIDAFLIKKPEDAQDFLEICGYIEALILKLNDQDQEKLLEKTCQEISRFPGLQEQQVLILELYGKLLLKKNSLVGAIRSLSTAFVLRGDLSLHKSLSRVFLLKALEGFEVHLQQAAGKGEVDSFKKLVKAIPAWHEKFSQEPEDIQKFYIVAREVYRNLNEKNRVQFSHFLEEIEEGEKQAVLLENQKFLTQRYYLKLEEMRACFLEEGEARAIQRERAAKIREFFQMLFEDALFILGTPPCKYDIRAMGSLAREEICPYSDLEYFILIEDENKKPYFQKLAEIFDLQILTLGETDPKHQELFNFGQKFGLEIDHQANPAFEETLLGIPEKVFAKPEGSSTDDLKAYKSRLTSVSIIGNHSFPLPRKGDADFAQRLLRKRRKKFESLQILQGDTCLIKEEFMEPLFHFLGDLGLFFGIQESSTLDLIDALPRFNESSKYLLKTAVEDLYRLRVRLHLFYRGIREEASLNPSLELTTLTQQERESLKRIHQLVLLPLYAADLEEGEIDLIAIALQRPNRENVAFATPYIQENHLFYYQLLSSPDYRDLQALFLEQVPSRAHVLAEIPNRAGYRQSRRLEVETLRKRIENISTDNSTSGIKIRSPLIGDQYLTVDSAKALVDDSGHIIRKYKDSLHIVNDFQNLHFKELPYQPLMEYAVYSLWHRIMGKASPATVLARIEIPSMQLVYPVIISETIEGEKLNSDETLYSQHLTWLRLCEILTKPGDGRLSNYVVQSGRVYCVDNDISFMEPVIKSFRGRSVTFVSSLFTLDQPLDQEVLEQFCSLEPDLILTDWLEELQRQEELYSALFSPQELENFYNQDTKRRFSTTLMLAKGTIATLCMQFYHLQDVLRQTKFTDPSLLLRELISFEESTRNQVGLIVERQYRKALKKPFARRLEEATAARENQSMTSEKAMRLNYKKVPTFEEIQERKTYSLEEAFKELCLLETQKLWNQVFIVQDREEYAIEADFNSLQDPEREKLMLRALQFLYDAKKQKPRTLTLRHTQTLTPTILRTLLHPGLRSLDLSYGELVSERAPLFGESTLSEIHALSPNLEELHLEGCSSLQKPALTLSSLRRLNISHCPNLTTLKIESAQLQELKINHSPNLRALMAPLTIETEVDWKETPNLSDPNFIEQLYQLGKQHIEGEGGSSDPKRVVALWEKAAAGGNSEALELLPLYQYRLGKRYAVGKQVPLDPERAVSLWEKAARGENNEAQEVLGWKKRMEGNRNLDLNYSQIDDHGTKAFAQALTINRTLTSLNLSNNKIGVQGSEAFGKALTINRTLISFNLSFNQIGDQGAEAFAKALTINQTLTSLYLSFNQIGDQGVGAIAKSLTINQTLKSLYLGRNQIGDQGGVTIGESLTINQTLTSLNLWDNQIGEQSAAAIGEALTINRTLTSLNLWNNQIEDRGAEALAKALITNRTLTSLNLSNNKIGNHGAKALAKTLKINQSLTFLNLSDNQIEDQGTTAIAKALTINRTLAFLDLHSNQITAQCAEAIGEALTINRTLTSFDLRSNQINVQGAEVIGEVLITNRTLTSLNLSNNQIGDQGADAFAETLKNNQSLTCLNLWDNQIGDQGAGAFAEALITNRTLTSLNLSNNQIGTKGAKAFAEVFIINRTLTSLDLRSNQIDDQGGVAIGEVLKINQTLISLDLSNNQIGVEGARAIAKTLTTNRTLTSLNLSNNQIRNQGGVAIGEALTINRTLTLLDLSFNQIDETAEVAIKEKLNRNRLAEDKAFKAAKEGNTRLVELLRQGVSLYSQDDEKKSFLHVAAANGHLHLIQSLLALSQNPTFPKWENKEGKTALDLARENGHTDIVVLLTNDDTDSN